ncbi:hypothetical protein F5148DRAFT_506866 [Russula earlei]|uniref:Uncharacterized protein n=1 Tax=Russula earlei TaxID=71964 RepID=A0ACC0UIU1_9AGAM|nr:hypothetical protein F5148DRAFT_506866 [Russula earlei]
MVVRTEFSTNAIRLLRDTASIRKRESDRSASRSQLISAPSAASEPSCRRARGGRLGKGIGPPGSRRDVGPIMSPIMKKKKRLSPPCTRRRCGYQSKAWASCQAVSNNKLERKPLPPGFSQIRPRPSFIVPIYYIDSGGLLQSKPCRAASDLSFEAPLFFFLKKNFVYNFYYFPGGEIDISYPKEEPKNSPFCFRHHCKNPHRTHVGEVVAIGGVKILAFWNHSLRSLTNVTNNVLTKSLSAHISCSVILSRLQFSNVLRLFRDRESTVLIAYWGPSLCARDQGREFSRFASVYRDQKQFGCFWRHFHCHYPTNSRVHSLRGDVKPVIPNLICLTYGVIHPFDRIPILLRPSEKPDPRSGTLTP